MQQKRLGHQYDMVNEYLRSFLQNKLSDKFKSKKKAFTLSYIGMLAQSERYSWTFFFA